MKKIISILCIALQVILLFGCGNKNVASVENTILSEPLVNDYFPVKANTRYVYEGKGNEYASYDVYIDYNSENKIQQRINNGATVTANVIELIDGKAIKLFSKPEVYYREDFLGSAGEGEILLMEPIKVGTAWTLKDSSKRSITNLSVNITTPSGEYKAIEVTTQGQNGKNLAYYAKDVGLVKSVFISEGSEISSSLSKIEQNVTLTQKINFYYPDINAGKIYYKGKDISFKTNDITKDLLEKAYKETIGNNTSQVFSQNAKINSLSLKNDIVYIDLNKAFLTDMNAGSAYEQMILQSIVNTFGHYYNSQKVIITIDNNLYESGHIKFKEGEYLTVNDQDTVEIK